MLNAVFVLCEIRNLLKGDLKIVQYTYVARTVYEFLDIWCGILAEWIADMAENTIIQLRIYFRVPLFVMLRWR